MICTKTLIHSWLSTFSEKVSCVSDMLPAARGELIRPNWMLADRMAGQLKRWLFFIASKFVKIRTKAEFRKSGRKPY
jgi:hypothetical protein